MKPLSDLIASCSGALLHCLEEAAIVPCARGKAVYTDAFNATVFPVAEGRSGEAEGEYEIDYFQVDIAELRYESGKGFLFIAVDRRPN